MKKLLTVFSICSTLLVQAQVVQAAAAPVQPPQSANNVSYNFISQSGDYQIANDGTYGILTNEQSTGFTTQVGSPQLPVFTKKLVLPAGSIVTNVLSTNQNEELISSDILLYPAQPPKSWKTSNAFVSPNLAVYNSTNAFPSSIVEKKGDEVSQGYHIVTLEICPFKYIPSQKRLSLYRNINITVNYTLGGIEYQEKITKFRANLNKEWVASNVVNPALLNSISVTAKNVLDNPIATDKMVLHWKPSAYGHVPDYIIITSQALKPFFEPLATFKTKRGLPTIIVTTEQIYANYSGVDKSEKIRNYLKSAHKNWGDGLFVLLGGDTSVIPERIASYRFPPDKSPSDLYYSDVFKPNMPSNYNYNWNDNGNAIYGEDSDGLELGGDNYIGRAPVDTSAEAQNFVNKVINYESLSGVSEKSYVNNMLFLGSYLSYSGASSSVGGQQWFDEVSKQPFLLNNPTLKKWKLYDDYQTIPNRQPYLGDEELNKTNTVDRLNNGKSGIGKFHLVAHYDHGGPQGIGVSGVMKSNSVYREDMDALTNGNYLQIMYTTACSPGKFTLDAFAEHYINNPNGGGVAILANTETVYAEGVQQPKKLFQSIYGNLSSNSHLMGVAFANTREAFNDSQRKKVLTLFGDPSMATWSATPQLINLVTPANLTINNTSANTLTVGLNSLTEIATVVLYKYNDLMGYPEIYTSKEVLPGATSAVFDIKPDTPGELLVQVTAKNYEPATKNVNILMPQSHLYVSGYTFVDSNGNGMIEAGENISLTLHVRNSGGLAIDNINAVLSGNSDLVSILSANSSYSTSVNAGETIELTGFTFKPLVAMGVNEIPDFLEFFVNLTASGNYSHLDNLYLNIQNSDLKLGKRALKNSSGNFPSFSINEVIKSNISIGNIGNIESGPLTGTISSTLEANGKIQIGVPTSNYQTIAANDEKSNVIPFEFKLIQQYTGAMPFKLTLTNAFGKIWEFNFDMNEAMPPLVTGFNFTSSVDQINLMWNAVSNISGYNIYRSNTENGTYTKRNDKLITGSAAFSDYNLDRRAKYYYKISAVSLSGNERALVNIVTQDTPAKQGYLAWTSLNAHGAFPVVTGSTVYASPMLHDVDGDGKKEIFQNSITANSTGRIYGFLESGQEMYNIDGNETTISGFADTNLGLWSNSAIGDLDKDGQAEIITMGRIGNSSAGLLHIHKTIDENGDNMPDNFWDTPYDTGWRSGSNPVLYDINNDGILEMIIANENQKVQVFDKNKNLMPGWPVQIPGGGDWSGGSIAVADLDNDGFAEIAIGVRYSSGTKGGIYIFRHDGTPFTTNPFKEFGNYESADGGITFADIDGDSKLELLTTTRYYPNESTYNNIARVYAFKLNGNPVNQIWNGQHNFPLNNDYGDIPRISVGDINNDGNLEIAFAGLNKLYVLKNDGSLLNNQFPITISDAKNTAPILADIDGDDDIEIIINSGGVINAYNPDGSECVGWRLKSDNGSPFRSSPSIDDIDNDGLNEIVISTLDGTVYAWDTDGSANRIEWGSHRADTSNTGTYKNGCLKGIDLMIKDGPSDLGIEPNNFTEYMWTSEDIWVRNSNDNGVEHQNPKYKTNGQPNYIKVRIANRGCKPSTGTETLTMNWAKANTNLSYPENWNGSMQNNSGFPLGGQVSTAPVTIPVIQPGSEVIVTIPWIVPNPNNYLAGDGSENPWHFCVLATILGVGDPLSHPYTSNPNVMVKENNNQAWKNLTVVNVNSDSGTLNPYPTAVVAVSNTANSTRTYNLELVKEATEEGNAIFNEAEVTVSMDNVLYNAWERGGESTSNLQNKNSATPNLKIVQGNNAQLSNVSMNAHEYGLITLNFNFLTQELTDKSKFTYHLIQRDANTGEIIGGETFLITKSSRIAFEADAGGNMAVQKNQAITLKAITINEPAIYNWYDSNGNLIYEGTNLEIPNAVASSYQLEVISGIDGFKDYDSVNITLLPSSLDQIAPNPVSNNALIKYTLNGVNSAYLRVSSYFDNIQHNYILDVNSSQTTINFNGYSTGAYVVSLICDGKVVSSKTLIKQ